MAQLGAQALSPETCSRRLCRIPEKFHAAGTLAALALSRRPTGVEKSLDTARKSARVTVKNVKSFCESLREHVSGRQRLGASCAIQWRFFSLKGLAALLADTSSSNFVEKLIQKRLLAVSVPFGLKRFVLMESVAQAEPLSILRRMQIRG